MIEVGGLHLSSMRSGFEGFSSDLGFESGLGFFMAVGGCIGRFADRGERTSIASGGLC